MCNCDVSCNCIRLGAATNDNCDVLSEPSAAPDHHAIPRGSESGTIRSSPLLQSPWSATEWLLPYYLACGGYVA